MVSFEIKQPLLWWINCYFSCTWYGNIVVVFLMNVDFVSLFFKVLFVFSGIDWLIDWSTDWLMDQMVFNAMLSHISAIRRWRCFLAIISTQNRSTCMLTATSSDISDHRFSLVLRLLKLFATVRSWAMGHRFRMWLLCFVLFGVSRFVWNLATGGGTIHVVCMPSVSINLYIPI